MNQEAVINKKIAEAIFAERTRRNWSKARLGRELGGISGQSIGQYEAGAKTPGGEFFMKWQKLFGFSLSETNVSRETDLQKGQSSANVINPGNFADHDWLIKTLAAANQSMADSTRSFSKSQETFSESFKIIADTNSQLAKRVLTAGYDQEKFLAVFATVSGIQEVLIEVSAKVKNISKEEAAAQLGRRVNSAVEKVQKADIHAGGGIGDKAS